MAALPDRAIILSDDKDVRLDNEEEHSRIFQVYLELFRFIYQIAGFILYLQSLGIPAKNMFVLVLCTTRLLLAAGLMPSHIYIPQPDTVEASRMLEQYPTLRVFAGLRAGDLSGKWPTVGSVFTGYEWIIVGLPKY